jgi:hypothetical protein
MDPSNALSDNPANNLVDASLATAAVNKIAGSTPQLARPNGPLDGLKIKERRGFGLCALYLPIK